MALQQIYVDPSIAGASGAGTVGDPYGDLQHALDTMTRDAANGDQINIKAGTDEAPAAALDMSTYGTPDATGRLTMRGYTTAANDGGIGGIDLGGGNFSLFASTALDYITLIELHVHNSGSADIIDLDQQCAVIKCEINNSSGGGIDLGGNSRVTACHIHDCGAVGYAMAYGSYAAFNYFANGAKEFTTALYIGAAGSVAEFNDVKVDGASNGIHAYNNSVVCRNNTVWASAGTGYGITGAGSGIDVIANYVEGFSGVGGDGYVMSGDGTVYSNNRWFNCTNGESVTGDWVEDTDNSVTAASALIDPANGDFRANGYLRAGAWPDTFPEIALNNYLDIGAVQRKEPLPIWARRQART